MKHKIITKHGTMSMAELKATLHSQVEVQQQTQQNAINTQQLVVNSPPLDNTLGLQNQHLITTSLPIIQTPVIQNQDNSARLLEEIHLLKTTLQQKDVLIEKLYHEKQELSTKLAVSESTSQLLMKEFTELKQDKIDLRHDKARQDEQINQLKQSELEKVAKLEQQNIELEQLKKQFAELSIDSSFLQEMHQVEQINNNQINQLDIAHQSDPFINLEIVESVLIGNNSQVIAEQHPNSSISLIGQSVQSVDSSLIE